jgi:hypothetical protein
MKIRGNALYLFSFDHFFAENEKYIISHLFDFFRMSRTVDEVENLKSNDVLPISMLLGHANGTGFVNILTSFIILAYEISYA